MTKIKYTRTKFTKGICYEHLRKFSLDNFMSKRDPAKPSKKVDHTRAASKAYWKALISQHFGKGSSMKKEQSVALDGLNQKTIEEQVNILIAEGKAENYRQAMRILLNEKPELFGKEPVMVDVDVDEEVFDQIAKAIAHKYQYGLYVAKQVAREAIKNGTILKVLGHQGFAHLQNGNSGNDAIFKAVAEYRKNNPNASHQEALRELRKATETVMRICKGGASVSEFDKAVAKYRSQGMSGIQAMRAARREVGLPV